jgi:hypothetical protein
MSAAANLELCCQPWTPVANSELFVAQQRRPGTKRAVASSNHELSTALMTPHTTEGPAPNGVGVVVGSVLAGSSAASTDIHPGCKVLGVNGFNVASFTVLELQEELARFPDTVTLVRCSGFGMSGLRCVDAPSLPCLFRVKYQHPGVIRIPCFSGVHSLTVGCRHSLHRNTKGILGTCSSANHELCHCTDDVIATLKAYRAYANISNTGSTDGSDSAGAAVDEVAFVDDGADDEMASEVIKEYATRYQSVSADVVNEGAHACNVVAGTTILPLKVANEVAKTSTTAAAAATNSLSTSTIHPEQEQHLGATIDAVATALGNEAELSVTHSPLRAAGVPNRMSRSGSHQIDMVAKKAEIEKKVRIFSLPFSFFCRQHCCSEYDGRAPYTSHAAGRFNPLLTFSLPLTSILANNRPKLSKRLQSWKQPNEVRRPKKNQRRRNRQQRQETTPTQAELKLRHGCKHGRLKSQPIC